MRMRAILTGLFILLAVSAFAQSYEVYVSDTGNRQTPPFQILKFDEDGANPTVFITSPLNRPQDILFLEESNTVLISNLGSGRISRHDAMTGQFISEFATGIASPTRIKIGPDGFIYVLQWDGTGRVRRYTLDGESLGNFTTTNIPDCIGLDWDQDGNLYVASFSEAAVYKFDPEGKSRGLFIRDNLLGPTNIWFDSNGDLLVLDWRGTAVKRFDSSGHYLGDLIQGVREGEGVGFLPNGHILIGDGRANSVKEFDSDGQYVRDFAPPRTANLVTPNAVVVRELPPAIPRSPDRLRIIPSDQSVRLEWRDNSDNEEGFRVYRRTDGSSRTLIATLASNVTTHTDDTIEASHVYAYSVTAFNGSEESDSSNHASISTGCEPPSSGILRRRPVRRIPCIAAFAGDVSRPN